MTYPNKVSRRQLLGQFAALGLVGASMARAQTQPAALPVSPEAPVLLAPGQAFEALWNTTTILRSQLEQKFNLVSDATVKSLENYTAPVGPAKGKLYAFRGGPLERLVQAQIQAGPIGTMRLTAWLKGSLEVPHLVMEFGVLPQLFVYLDYAPRTDLMLDFKALETYYNPVSADLLKIAADKRFSPYISPSAYVRQFQSSAALNFSAAPTLENLTKVQDLARVHFERWLGWVDSAKPTPIAARAALNRRDLVLRRESAERDPGNALAARLFGPELSSKLVKALWSPLP